ncbi:MAG: DUF131 domain-containing protein [Candidatus Aenigmatarchaeota archaeon]
MDMDIAFIGILLIVIGFLILLFAAKPEKVEWGFGGFIGPIPFGFASSKTALWVVIAITILVAVTLFALKIFG